MGSFVKNFLALAGWCAKKGRLRKLENGFSGEILLQGSAFRCLSQ